MGQKTCNWHPSAGTYDTQIIYHLNVSILDAFPLGRKPNERSSSGAQQVEPWFVLLLIGGSGNGMEWGGGLRECSLLNATHGIHGRRTI